MGRHSDESWHRWESWQPGLIAHVAEAAWNGSYAERSARCHNGRPCPTRVVPYGSHDPHAQRLAEACLTDGCLDLIHDLISRTLAKLRPHREEDRQIKNLPAYVRTVVSAQLVELSRAERVSRGFPAKPTRTDGVAGRVQAQLEALGGKQGEWLVALFRIMRSYPYTIHHVQGRWPVEGLREERALHFPGEANSRQEVQRDIATVTAIARRHAGSDWVYSNLTLPLQANGTHSEFPTDCHEGGDIDIDRTLGRLLRETYARFRTLGHLPIDALKLAAREVTGATLEHLDAESAAALEELDLELGTSKPACPTRICVAQPLIRIDGSNS